MYEQPASNPEDATAWSHSLEQIPAYGRETILFVEDETFVRRVTGEVLRSAGYSVLTARSAAEALVLYAQHRGAVGLLLTDVILPGETGLALAGKLRLADPQLKVLFITGYAEQLGRCDLERAECLAKPFSTEVLLRRVKGLLTCSEAPAADPNFVRRACGSA